MLLEFILVARFCSLNGIYCVFGEQYFIRLQTFNIIAFTCRSYKWPKDNSLYRRMHMYFYPKEFGTKPMYVHKS